MEPSTVSGSRPSAATVVDTVPTWLAAGQVSPANSAAVQSGGAVGSPIIPGGRWIVRSLTSSPGVVKPMLTWKSLCAPVAVSSGAAWSPVKPSACAAGAAARHAIRATPPCPRTGTCQCVPVHTS
jgi:hypothetical protein